MHMTLDNHFDVSSFPPMKPKDLGIDYTKLSSFEKILQMHGGQTAVERKYDGYGIKFDTAKGEIYSLDDTRWDLACVPEIAEALRALPPMVGIGELVGKPTHEGFTNIDEFKAVSSRSLVKYSPNVEKAAKEKPLELRVYDILELRGKDVSIFPLKERRVLLEKNLDKESSVLPTEAYIVDSAAELKTELEAAFDKGSEGFVVKDLRTPYKPGTRTQAWLKLKQKVAVDVLVVGLYQTEERLAQGWPCSNALGAVYNRDTGKYETFVKINMPSKAVAEELCARVAEHAEYTWSEDKPFFWDYLVKEGKKTKTLPRPPAQTDESVVYNPIMFEQTGQMMRKIPFQYIKNPAQNSVVVEVSGMNVSSGEETLYACGMDTGRAYTVRQPIFSRFRDDKRPDQVTTTDQILAYVDGL
jgi:ATP-dependent DNA ligase